MLAPHCCCCCVSLRDFVFQAAFCLGSVWILISWFWRSEMEAGPQDAKQDHPSFLSTLSFWKSFPSVPRSPWSRPEAVLVTLQGDARKVKGFRTALACQHLALHMHVDTFLLLSPRNLKRRIVHPPAGALCLVLLSAHNKGATWERVSTLHSFTTTVSR